MTGQCETPTPLKPIEIAETAGQLAEKMGGSVVCKKTSDTASKTAGASGNAEAEFPFVGAKTGFQVSATALDNKMEESGCGALTVAAQKILTNSQQIQCILEKSSSTSNTNVSTNASIAIRTIPLTAQQVDAMEKTIERFIRLNPASEYLSAQMTAIGVYNTVVGPTERIIPNVKEINQSYSDLIDQVGAVFGGNASFEDLEINQSIGGSVKLIGNISETDMTQLENLSKEISKIAAETITKQKLGFNALTPSSKSVTDTVVNKNTQNSSSVIRDKIKEIKMNINNSASIVIEAPGNTNMKKVRINQNILIDIATQSIINTAIATGIKSGTDILTETSSVQKIESESKGIDDAIKTQGEVNAAAIKAAIPPRSEVSLTGLAGMVIVVVLIWVLRQNTFMVISLAVIGAIVGVVIFLMSMAAYNEKQAKYDLEINKKRLQRPLSLYKTLFNRIGCDSESLTEEDMYDVDSLSDTFVNEWFIGFEKASKDPENALSNAMCFPKGKKEMSKNKKEASMY